MTTTSNHHFSCPNHLSSSSSYDLIRSVYSIASRTLVQHVVPRERKRGDDGGAGRRRPTRRVCFDSLFQLLARTTLGYQTFFFPLGVSVCACSSLHVSTCSPGSRSLQRMPIRGEGWLRVPWKGGTHRRPVFVFFFGVFLCFWGGSRGEWGTVAMYRVPRGCFFLFFFCSR